ncbi:unnamed protein product [Schistocephalus solidus]|uniref:E3 ubiquitin-protein ligase TRAIP n=1 Tax=Schistocephalus solidus TaxID=70667 RepID=A0A183SWV4_SCHSO|nr:unnamed protein product [Schistocephalus solidus]
MIIAQCVICQELLGGASEENLLALFCGHVFHVTCAETWLKSSSTCPQCRLPVARRQIIRRLYFSAIDRASTSLLLPEVTGQAQDESVLPCAGSDNQNAATIALALQKARSEVVRLNNAVSALKTDLESAQKKLKNSENEMKTISSLYSEADRLYSAERQKLKQARIELSSYKELLREAESIKLEGLELRKKMEEMQDLQTLIASSEEAANDLLRRYTGDPKASASAAVASASPSGGLRTVCRWAAVLRSELTSARAKIQQYRAEAHRLRRVQAAATKRVLTAEARCAEQKQRLRHLESELTTVRSVQSGTPVLPSTSSVDLVSPATSTPSTPQMGSQATPESVGLQTCLRYVDMNTPDLDSLSWAPNQNLAAAKVSAVTPCRNPFKMTDSPNPTPSARVTATSASQENDSCGWPEESAHSSRRPSSLLALAIMRNYVSGKSSENHLYNGLGGHESSASSAGFFSRPAQQCQPRARSKKVSKQKSFRATQHSEPMGAAKNVQLDAFFRK